VTGDVQLVAPQEQDAARIAALICSCADESGQGLVDEDEIRFWIQNPDYDVANNARLALRDGAPIGYVDLEVRGGGTRVHLDARLPADMPGAEEVARTLLAFALGRARVLAADSLAAGTQVVVRAISLGGEAWVALIEHEGFRPVRTFYEMRIDLAVTPPVAPRWPSGIAERALAEGEERALHAAHEEAFADVWGHTRRSFEEWWRHAGESPGFDRSLWRVACDRDQIAGYALCWAEQSARPELGWVGALGVRGAWRRRGVALALLHAAFCELGARGRSQVGLGVDGDSTTGAVALYERAGMHVHARSTSYERPLVG
jgi:ribosomal protein S18 acetylase RimI-like enzyme